MCVCVSRGQSTDGRQEGFQQVLVLVPVVVVMRGMVRLLSHYGKYKITFPSSYLFIAEFFTTAPSFSFVC